MAERFIWFLAGVGLGTLAGVLYAPQSGDETRESIREKAREGRYETGRQAYQEATTPKTGTTNS
jgi:gas vesicle protein